MELQTRQSAKAPMEDEKIIELYFERNEKAIEETDFKYKKYLFSLLIISSEIDLTVKNA